MSTINIKGIKDISFGNYKKISMFICFPTCNLKCDRECGKSVCQNSELLKIESTSIEIDSIIKRYKKNRYDQALVIGGLEPFDTMKSCADLLSLIVEFRKVYTEDDIVIYTGYTEEELEKDNNTITIEKFRVFVYQFIKNNYPNIYMKFGRYIPNQNSHYDPVLGVDLASDNQYGKKIS